MTPSTRRTWAALVITAGVTLAACGGTPDDASPVESATADPTESPSTSSTAPTQSSPEAVPAPTTTGAAATTVPDDDANAAATTEPTEATAPDDGCSTDGSPTAIGVADGPAPELPVAAESADSPFPDLAVRQLNCAPGWVQLRDEIPAETPVLAWFWAPH